MFARMRDKKLFERVYWDFQRMYMEPNLNSWWTTRPYVMDASGAVTAGMAEALMQSHAGEIHLLPCLPDMWSEGRFEGFRARGGVTVSAEWKAGSVTAKLVANHDGKFKVRYENNVREVSLKKGKSFEVKFKR